MPSFEKLAWADEGGQKQVSSRLARLSPGDQLLAEPALPLFQNLFVVCDGNAVSMVPLEDFKSLLAS